MYYSDVWKSNFEIEDNETLNDIFNLARRESYQIPVEYWNDEDKKRLAIS